MLLTVDIGNTNVVLGLFGGGEEPLAVLRAPTIRDATPGQLGVLVDGLCEKMPDGEASVSRTILCSVVPDLSRAFCEYVRTALAQEPVVVSAETDLGIPVRVDDPREVGADRIVNALAAREAVGSPAIVVDLGTATTFDCLDNKGAYIGGVIAPGVETSAEDLIRRAARLCRVDLRFPSRVIGTNTRDCVQSGILHGAAKMIDGMVEAIRAEMREPAATVLATGGLAPVLAPRCGT
ncbi:MAG: type III pantothenate kinase, partial [Gemmatimonadota bacterium]|nr:type III pantothenate kinase [Gemmatimonadota bacterium]